MSPKSCKILRQLVSGEAECLRSLLSGHCNYLVMADGSTARTGSGELLGVARNIRELAKARAIRRCTYSGGFEIRWYASQAGRALVRRWDG